MPVVQRRLSSLSRICRLDDLPDGQVTIVHLAPEVPASAAEPTATKSTAAQARSALVLRSGEAVHAFENRCPHFGTALAQRQEHMIYVPHTSLSCNVHYARFRWHDGYCESGDCQGESLTPLAVELQDGEVLLAIPT